MKQILATALILFLFISTKAQSYKPTYLGEDFLFYKKSLFKLKPKNEERSNLNHTFYSDLQDVKFRFNNNVIYPDKEYDFSTVTDSLDNKIFIVDDIINNDGSPYNKSSLNDPIFVLKDTLTKNKIYYFYDQIYEHNFLFTVANLNTNKSFDHTNITREFDDFTNEITLRSPVITNGELSALSVSKTIKGNKVAYYLSLQSTGLTASVGGKGVYILFKDKSKLVKIAENVDVKVANHGAYEYSAFFKLTPNDLLLLSNKNVSKFRLYIFDEKVSEYEGEKLKAYINYLKKMK